MQFSGNYAFRLNYKLINFVVIKLMMSMWSRKKEGVRPLAL